MTDEARREIVHKVNNLLAVIYTQTAVARSVGTLEAAHEALRQIEKTAASTRELVQRADDAAS